jgi:hypothetical protein
MSVSPFETELVETEKFIESALNRFAATSKEDLVRVDGSKKRLIIVRPLRVGTFFIGLVEISRKLRAVFKMSLISATDRSAIPKRCLPVNGMALPTQFWTE